MRLATTIGGFVGAAVLTLAPTAAFGADYGGVGNQTANSGGGVSAGNVSSGGVSSGTLPSTGSDALTGPLGAAGLLLLAGGGATIAISRRKAAHATA